MQTTGHAKRDPESEPVTIEEASQRLAKQSRRLFVSCVLVALLGLVGYGVWDLLHGQWGPGQ